MDRFKFKDEHLNSIKIRLYNKDRGDTKEYSLSKLIYTKFKRNSFEYRGMSTGLKDKNGILIYEGDIVKISNGSVNGEVIESELAVEWIDKVGRYNLPSWTSDVPDWSHYVEIIGNIHTTGKDC